MKICRGGLEIFFTKNSSGIAQAVIDTLMLTRWVAPPIPLVVFS